VDVDGPRGAAAARADPRSLARALIEYDPRIRAVLQIFACVALASGVATADTLRDLEFTPPAGWDEGKASSLRRTYTQGKAYISISVGELSTLDLPADATPATLAKTYTLDGTIKTEGDTQVAGAPGYAMLYQAGDGIALITATTAGGGTVFQLDTTRATMDADLATFAKLVDTARLPEVEIAKVPEPAAPGRPPSRIDAAQLARLPDSTARKVANALADAVAVDAQKQFLAMTPRKGLAIGKQKYKRARLAKAIAEAGIGALLGWDPEAPFGVVFDRKKKKQFGVYRGSGSGVTAVVIFKKKGRAWAVSEVRVLDFGEP